MHDVTWVIWPYPNCLSITPDQMAIERQERHQCVQNELSNPMIFNTTTLGRGNDLASRDLTMNWGQHETWLFQIKSMYIIRHVWKSQTRWCQYVCSAILFLKVICKKKNEPRHLGHWPELWRHRFTWDMKFRYQSLRLVTPDTLVFFAKL